MTNVLDWLKVTAKEVKELHTNDDLDSGVRAHHHTLGTGINQAARGSDLKQTQSDVSSITADVTALETTVNDHENRLDSLETALAASIIVTGGAGFTGNAVINTYQSDVNLASSTFVAPASGAVLIAFNSFIRNLTAGQAAKLSCEVRAGNVIGVGAIVFAPTDNQCIGNFNTQFIKAECIVPIEGLTPGSTYNVRLMYNQANAAGAVFSSNVLKIVVRR